jgi:hypothetical protein
MRKANLFPDETWAQAAREFHRQPDYAIANMIRALSFGTWQNTREENERLALARVWMSNKKKRTMAAKIVREEIRSKKRTT